MVLNIYIVYIDVLFFNINVCYIVLECLQYQFWIGYGSLKILLKIQQHVYFKVKLQQIYKPVDVKYIQSEDTAPFLKSLFDVQYVRKLYFSLDVKRVFVYCSKIVLGRNRRIEVSALSGKELCQLIDNLKTNGQKKFWADMALMTQQHFPSKAFAKTYYHCSFRLQNADDEVCDVM
ncbi:Hypothetical_protein [Hexamita inflata]|uniref:Hypothetical_protein n=1 Tax=Hexamita inflata TaxID=28002 RepID=A0ABP1I165_9EUKA